MSLKIAPPLAHDATPATLIPRPCVDCLGVSRGIGNFWVGLIHTRHLVLECFVLYSKAGVAVAALERLSGMFVAPVRRE